MFSFKISWEGNPVSLNKSFGKCACTLCMKEQLKVSECSEAKKKFCSSSIDGNSEMFGACRRKPRFHRFPSGRNANRNSAEAGCVPSSLITCGASTAADRPASCFHASPRQTSSTDDWRKTAERASRASKPVLNVVVENLVSFDPPMPPLSVAEFCMPTSTTTDVQLQHQELENFQIKSLANALTENHCFSNNLPTKKRTTGKTARQKFEIRLTLLLIQ